ncbi:MAG TPA: protein kinase [Kofleriaceae bacterium]|nr:protein kinase [Kofleriaceae bacterium]
MVEVEETLSETEQQQTPALPLGRLGGDDELLPMTLMDRYQIERRLGAGAMGVVYAARDIHLRRAVAIKVVGPRIDTGSGQGRLVREAQAMAKLRHPNLATVHDIGVSKDRLFVVMELVDGGTVADWLRAEPRSWRAILAVYLQAARGLAAAHAAGFVHRDFKPENVLYGKDGVARVSDFGVARVLGQPEHADPAEGVAEQATATRAGGVVGTPGYIAPEILRHEPVDQRADQFSFCVAVYAALYGERPFEPLEGSSRIAETLGRLRTPRAGIVPRWLQGIISRGLAADRRDRWPTIDALTSAIERRLGRRRRVLVLAGFAVMVHVLAASVVGIAMRATPAPPTPPPPDWSPVLAGGGKDSPPPAPAASAELSPALAPLAWWLGDWDASDGTGSEHWIAAAGAIYGVALHGDTFEVLVIDDGDGPGRYYGVPRLFVMPSGARSVELRRSTIGDGTATFASDEHDFPTTITYERAADGAGLAARLGGAGKLSSFRFKRGTRSPAPELETADLAFAAATAQRGVDGWVAAFDPKGGMIRNARRVEYAAIAEFMTPTLSSYRLDWAPIASGKSGDLGFTVGKGTFTGAGPRDGARVTYVTIWRRQPDGAWKVLFDLGRDVQE